MVIVSSRPLNSVRKPFLQRGALAHSGFGVRTFCIVALVACFSAAPAFGQEDDEDPFLPGLVGRYELAGGQHFARVDRAIAFHWSEKNSDPRLPDAAFGVQWRGRLQSQATGPYQIHAYYSGQLKVELNGRKALEGTASQAKWQSSKPIELPYDHHPLTITYKKTTATGGLQLFWSGPQFQLEPIDGRRLFHDREQTKDKMFERGQLLVRALRCGACHEIAGDPEAIPGPSLERVADTLNGEWMRHWLTAPVPRPAPGGGIDSDASRRMPYFAIRDADARAMAASLVNNSQRIPPAELRPPPNPPRTSKSKKNKDKEEPEPPPKPPAEAGRELFLTLGCLACHQWNELGTRDWFDGGDLSKIADKRTTRFFEHWLRSPHVPNPRHRMPVFDLTDREQFELTTFLQTLGSSSQAKVTELPVDDGRGRQLLAQYRCTSCHAVPNGARDSLPKKSRIGKTSNWGRSCTEGTPRGQQPQYSLSASDRAAIRMFFENTMLGAVPASVTGAQLLTENNCVACHQRQESLGLAPHLTKLGQAVPDLAAVIPAMTPPALNSIGDKFHEEALLSAMKRSDPPHRSYLLVRMPRFKFSDLEWQSLIDHFVTADRIPAGAPLPPTPEQSAIDPALLESVGNRLVTPDGFGCTSCHQVGQVVPAKAPLNARGPNLSLLGKRVRHAWFDRFVRNPARIVPRMEMPSVQVAVRGVLGDNLDHQLAAVWEVLNKPGFQPPEPNPVRVVRHTGMSPTDSPIVVTDVLRAGTTTYIKPLLIGLSNRHNILFDLDHARFSSWLIGDTARQRTEGKTWFWEAAGKTIHQRRAESSELRLRRSNGDLEPLRVGQFVTEFDTLEQIGATLRFRYRLHFAGVSRPIRVSQTFTPWSDAVQSGFQRVIELHELPDDEFVHLEVIDPDAVRSTKISKDGRTLTLSGPAPVAITLQNPAAANWDANGLDGQSRSGGLKLELLYSTQVPVDRFPIVPPSASELKVESLQVVPGFVAQRLPLSDEIMPTALGWRPDGTLVIASLKGQIWQASDSNGDGVEDRLASFYDGLAAPYGIHISPKFVDVANKYAVLRLSDENDDGRADRAVTIASGWGHTADYHDWAVGLPRDDEGNYYVALPCQQDERSVAAANLRGHFLKLVPRRQTVDDPRLFSLETISRGHRFPMGIAHRNDGEFFVTDNQGNYNPFNELNHIRPEAHFGFINAVEQTDAKRPPLAEPAINLPHPWVRSVNGICFLETPKTPKEKSVSPLFGPFEGHLIGCEYDTRRLIRMSLQRVGDSFQGAAYPFSFDQPVKGAPFLGPIVCGVAPRGDLYVGGLRDSGWGGANNVGEIVRLCMQLDQLPCGIAEMQATDEGFELEFTAPVDPILAADPRNYSLASYTRESTPAYGGPDINQRSEPIQSVQVSTDSRRVTIRLSELRAGYVYELHVKKLVEPKHEFFPAEAHYTLLKVPAKHRP